MFHIRDCFIKNQYEMILKVKSAFIAILTFGRPLVTENVKYISFNNGAWLGRHRFINLNPFELCCYQFMVNLYTFNRSFNILDD